MVPLYKKANWHTGIIVENIVTPQERENEFSSMKRFGTYIKHKRNGNIGVASLKSDVKLCSHLLNKAQLLNKQFQSVFSSGNNVSRDDFIQFCPMPTSEEDFPTLKDISITENGIRKLPKDLNPSKSPCPDNLGPRVLKEVSDDLAPILTTIFRKSLATGEIPQDWRTANVSPVYKKGQKYLAENYRPISLTSVSAK